MATTEDGNYSDIITVNISIDLAAVQEEEINMKKIDLSTFNRVFKNFVGITPSQYRTDHLK